MTRPAPPAHRKKRFFKGRRDGKKKEREERPPERFKPEAEACLGEVFQGIGKPPEAPFCPDPFQLEALEAARRTDCIVIAPTGSGKTWIAEEAIHTIFERGGKIWYGSPLKALTNSKWVEFGQRFGRENVGILTGDTKDNAEAPIIVGTTEILRNQLYDVMHEGENLDCDLVILDEAHFLGDPERGVVWEEIMMYLPRRVNLLLLSATIGNGEEIAAWLEEIRGKECVVIREEGRPVPLYPLFIHPSGRVMPLFHQRRLYHKVKSFIDEGINGFTRKRIFTRFNEILQALARFHLLPALFFLQSRSECDAAVGIVRRGTSRWKDEERFERDLTELLERFPYIREHKQLASMRRFRVGAHHGGQLPAWKFAVETMMKKGHLDAVFATATMAAGVNFPARSVVLFNSDRYNGHECVPLNATELHQMTGRAGRRGEDNIGFMVAVPGRFMDLERIRKIYFKKPEKIESRIGNDFSMILNLLLSHRPEEIRDIFERSFADFQNLRAGKKGRADLWRDFRKHLDFLRQEGFVDEKDRLTDDGMWASRLRLDQPLLIAECLKKKVFPERDMALLCAMIAPFVYDRELDIPVKRKETPRKLRQAFDRMVVSLGPLVKRVREAGFDVSPLPFWTSVILYDWARGMDWEDVRARWRISDGDLAMLISRTADNLHQVAALRESHPEMAILAEEGRQAVLREPVVFE